jgi:hypothetical protein
MKSYLSPLKVAIHGVIHVNSLSVKSRKLIKASNANIDIPSMNCNLVPVVLFWLRNPFKKEVLHPDLPRGWKETRDFTVFSMFIGVNKCVFG